MPAHHPWRRRPVPTAAERVDQRQASAGQAGGIDRLVDLRNALVGVLSFEDGAAGDLASAGGGAALPATHVCLFRRRIALEYRGVDVAGVIVAWRDSLKTSGYSRCPRVGAFPRRFARCVHKWLAVNDFLGASMAYQLLAGESAVTRNDV